MRIIAGKFKGRPIKTPKSVATRPTQSMVREALFNICQNEIEGADFLDLFAGSGQLGLEALSRGASSVTFIEKSKEAISCIQQNIEAFNVQDLCTLLSMDAGRATEYLRKKKMQFDLIYVDPPYDHSFDLKTLLPMMKSSSILFLEERFRKEKPQTFPHLQLIDCRRFGSTCLSSWKLEECV